MTTRRPSFPLISGGVLVVALIVVLVVLVAGKGGPQPTAAPSVTQSLNTEAQLESLFQTHTSGVQIAGHGVVTHLLSDDNEGDRHQRFILELSSGQTLLIAHNIDIAPRLDGLAVGDEVEFFGEYDYNDQGGTIHWTHHDPQGSHVAGWIDWDGRRYA